MTTVVRSIGSPETMTKNWPIRISITVSRGASVDRRPGTAEGRGGAEVEPPAPLRPLADQILYDVALYRLDEQLSRSDALDTKASAAFAFGGTILPITFGLLSVVDRSLLESRFFWPLIYGSLAAFGVVILASAVCFMIRNFSLRPHLPTFRRYCDDLSNDVMRRWTANEYLLSVAKNENKLALKAWAVGVALLFAIVETVLLSLAVLTTL